MLEHLVIVSTDKVTTAENAFIHTVHYYEMKLNLSLHVVEWENSDPDSESGLDPDQSGLWILNRNQNPDPDPGGQKWPTKIEKNMKFHVLKCWTFSFEG
jgi:hypothetical protein